MRVSGFDDTIAWYDKNSKQYADALNTVVPTREIDKFLKIIGTEHPSILEAGCGPGRESTIFLARGAQITGVDVSQGLLAIAREKNPTAEYHNANFLSLPLPDATFDGVWSHASLVHLETIEDVRQALAEFHRVLKSGGYLYVFVKAQTGADKTAVVADALSKHDRFFRYYTEDELSELLKSVGFEILAQETQEDPHGRTEVKWIESVSKKR